MKIIDGKPEYRGALVRRFFGILFYCVFVKVTNNTAFGEIVYDLQA